MRVPSSDGDADAVNQSKRPMPMPMPPPAASAALPPMTVAAAAPPARPRNGRANRTVRRGSKLQLQCSDGSLFDVTHEEAMMSSTLWMLLQDVSDRQGRGASTTVPPARQHMIPIFDVPSASVDLALFYCRCLYRHQVEGDESAMHDWEDRFFSLDSKTLCDLAKVASNLDIQPLVDVTCRSIAQIMSATEAAHEIREKFGLEDAHGATVECSCELRHGMSTFDFDMFNSLDHDLATDEYELVEFDQPSVDELVNFINGESNSSSSVARSGSTSTSTGKTCQVHSNEHECAAHTSECVFTSSQSKKKKKKKNKKKKTNSNGHGHINTTTTNPLSCQSSGQQQQQQDVGVEEGSQATGAKRINAGRLAEKEGEEEEDEDEEEEGEEEQTARGSNEGPCRSFLASASADLQERVRLARQNPSAIFQESQFEDEEDEELDEQIESFRLALESAHLASRPIKDKPRLEFEPQDVFRIPPTATSTPTTS